jgi:hypothetical protein
MTQQAESELARLIRHVDLNPDDEVACEQLRARLRDLNAAKLTKALSLARKLKPGPFKPIPLPPERYDEHVQDWLNREGGWRWQQREEEEMRAAQLLDFALWEAETKDKEDWLINEKEGI